MISFFKEKNNQGIYFFTLFLLLLIILFIRVYSIYVLNIPLHFDEAQYWGWSKQLEWGYFSKPPILAFIIKMSTSACGETEFCIRISSPILYFFSSIFIFFSSRLLTQNSYLACLTTLIFYLMPGITFSSYVITTDVPLIFFSSVFAFLIIKIYKKSSVSNFYYFLVGVVFSLGFLSKYAMVYHLVSLTILLLFYKNIRSKVLSLKSVIYILIGLLLVVPHFYWNYNNNFVTFGHTADNANIHRINFNFKELFLFFFSQFIVFGIYPFYFILKSFFAIQKQDEEKVLLYIFFVTPLVIVSVIAFFSRANANWAVVGYPFGCILMAKLLEKKKVFNKIYSFSSQLLLSMVIIIIVISGQYTNKIDPFGKQKHARYLANEIKRELEAFENVAFMADDREDYALMLFYLKDFKGKRAKWNGDNKINDHYELTTDVNNLKGNDLIFVTRTKPTGEMLNRSSSSKLLKSLEFEEQNKTKKFNLYLLKNWE